MEAMHSTAACADLSLLFKMKAPQLAGASRVPAAYDRSHVRHSVRSMAESAHLFFLVQVKAPWLAGAALSAGNIHNTHALVALQHAYSHCHWDLLQFWHRLLRLGHGKLHTQQSVDSAVIYMLIANLDGACKPSESHTPNPV